MGSHHSHENDFVHLHLHTEYSLLDGFAQIKRVVKRAAELDMQALAITDHGTMFGVIDFYRECKKRGIKPIIGVEAYLARRGMQDRDPQLDRQPYHMLLLAQNETGYKNLLKIASAAQLEGFYYRPRIDKEFLAQHAEGLVATSGCLAAEIPRMVTEGRDDEARKQIGWYQDVFGPDNFFLELQQHDIPELESLNRWLLENQDYANVPLVATNDVHYVNFDDHDVHDTLLCIQTSELKTNPNRLMMTDPSYHLRSPDEMWRIFGEIAPNALYNTLHIMDMCDIHDMDDQQYHLPIFPVPEQFDNANEYLRYLCERGIEWRYGTRAESREIQERLKHELNIIFEMGFATYFLIVWDLVEFARSADIWWNVRGSGAGSVVAYSLGITSLDPLENALIFERFLNPHRKTMPDFDLDFPEDRRQEMIEYCARKYGENKVAAIITFGTLKPKAAIRDVGRALDLPLPEVDRLAKLVPAVPRPPSVKQLLGRDPHKTDEANAELIEIYERDQYARQVLDYAAEVEGSPRHAGTHAAGIIVADKPLVEYLPLHRPTSGSAEDAPVKQVTQFPMETAESIGLLKIDFLGLSTLTIMRRACSLIEKHHGIKYDMSNIPIKPDPDDLEITRMVEETFEMLGRGESIGVFQLESSGMRQMLVGMKPKTFEHIIAAIALYRPGPMQFIPQFNRRMHGQEAVEYLHPKLEPIIGNTYGIITYQEQIMQIAVELFGYTAGEADLMRKAVSKKKEKDLAEHRAYFIERGPIHGVDPKTAAAIFEQIEFFANYGFNKSHAADYAIITCQTAFLKCHYPHEYMTALMSVHRDDTNKIGIVIADAKRMGIDILPVDINYSMLDFDIETDNQGERHIRFGMGAVKNLGIGSCEYIIEERERNGAFENLDDFLDRCSANTIGKRGIESLIRVGALDAFEERPTLLHNLDKLMKHSVERHKAASVGQVSMFDLLGDKGADNAGSVMNILESPPGIVDKREQLRWEKELVGMYLTDHPLDAIMDKLDVIITHTSGEIHNAGEEMVGMQVTIAGLVDNIRNIITKRGDAMAILRVEDIDDQIECVMFPEVWGTYRDLVEEDRVLIVRGKVDARQGDMQIIVSEVSQDFTVAHSDDDTLDTIRNASFDWLPADKQPRSSRLDNPFFDEPPLDLFDSDPDFDDEPEEDDDQDRRNGYQTATEAAHEDHRVIDYEEDDIQDDKLDDDEDRALEDTEVFDEEVGEYGDAYPEEEDVEDETEPGLTDVETHDDLQDDEGVVEDDAPGIVTDEALVDDEPSDAIKEADDPLDDMPPLPDEEFPVYSSSEEPDWDEQPVDLDDPYAVAEPETGESKREGNGRQVYVDASGRLIPPSAPAAVPRQSTVRRRLTVTMTRRGDTEAEFRLLRWIYSKALSYPGTDELTIQARNPNSSELFKLDFPDLTINICDPLLRDLRARLGEDNIQIRNI